MYNYLNSGSNQKYSNYLWKQSAGGITTNTKIDVTRYSMLIIDCKLTASTGKDPLHVNLSDAQANSGSIQDNNNVWAQGGTGLGSGIRQQRMYYITPVSGEYYLNIYQYGEITGEYYAIWLQ